MANDDPAAAPGKSPSANFRRVAIRTLFSSAIAILFLLILMVAALQQQAASHLDANTGYTSAHAQVADIDLARARLVALQRDIDARREKIRVTERELYDYRERLNGSNNRIAELAAKIANSHLCPVFDNLPPNDGALWGAVYQCFYSGTVPKDINAEIKEIAGSAQDPVEISRRIANDEIYLRPAREEIVAKAAIIKTQQQQVDRASVFAEDMRDIVIFDRSPLGWFGLTWIPPATMQIVLSFVSGLFGSLLVTLVLTVYPNNDLHFTGSDSYWSRILLGGLIAVGVYIVIGGGLAVLSASNSDPDGSTNFLSFCAIGMLAGMFSDKFAGWLSDNAQKLTARRDPSAR